jgi:hypothetical protein
MMCITNDDAISNGSKHNNVMKKIKCLKKEKKNQKKIKMKEKNNLKKSITQTQKKKKT